MATLQSVLAYKKGYRSGSTKPSMAKIAKDFVNGELREDIEAAFEDAKLSDKELSVNTRVPGEAYSDMDKFVEECRRILTPLGYTHCEGSHDGGGMYGTLYVEWKL